MKVKVKVYIYARVNQYSDDKIEYIPYYVGPEIGDHMGAFVLETEVEFDPPSRADIINKTVAVLKNQQQSLRAECETKVQNIEQQIQEMLCLPAAVS